MKAFVLAMLCTVVVSAQVVIPDGTRLRVRLDQSISSASADEGQIVELSVTEAIKVADQVVIPEGARVTGTITQAQERRRMGRAGKLDFSIDRVRAVDGEWVPLRYTLNKKNGESHAVRTGVITAGVAVVFWPAAPVVLLMKGKDTTINKGVTFDAFTDQNHALTNSRTAGTITASGAAFQPVSSSAPGSTTGTAAVTIHSTASGADIEVDGGYVGSTPTTLQLTSGAHQIAVKSNGSVWQRTLQVTAGSSVTINAAVDERRVVTADRRR